MQPAGGGFRLRARWKVEKDKGGAWQIVITEIPYQIQKSRLIEKMAEMLQAKKLPVLADIRDESAEDIRVVLEPKSRRLDPKAVMESLFKLTELETRVSLNLNVLDSSGRPSVLSLKEALTEWLSHRRNVLIRRSKYRLGKIERRLEILEGYLVVFLNLDEVITIIRETDHPRDELMLRFSLSDVQANAILDMRLRSLRRLEEEALRTERDSLLAEQENLKNLLRDEEEQWQAVSSQIKSMRADFLKTDQRRTTLSDAPTVDIDVTELLIEKEPITVICSGKGWVRAMKGHLDLNAQFKFKDGDGPRFALHAETTDKLLVFAENGRFYTLGCDKLPKGRGFGEPLSLMMDVPADVSLVNIIKVGKGKLLVASDKGHGLIVDMDSALAQTRSGKQVLNLPSGARAVASCPAEGDHAAIVGQNRRLLIFPLNEIPEMTRGKGVILQRYKDGSLADVKTFNLVDGLSWRMGEKTRTERDLLAWQGRRGSAGRMPPIGFPRPARFT